MAQQIILENFHNGGLASTSYQLSPNTLFRAAGFDMQSEPGILKTSLLLDTDLASPDAKVNKIIFASDGYAYIFGDSQYIRKRDTAGTYTQPYTTAGWTGNIMNAIEFNGYIYFCNATNLYRYQMGAANWDSISSFASFAVGNTSYHPMYVFLDQLYIGDGRYVHNVDETNTYNSAVFDAKTPNVITSIISNGYSLLMGTTKTSQNISSVNLYEWDMVSPNFCNVVYTVNEPIVNGMFYNGDNVLVSAGYQGSLYQISGIKLQKIEQLTFDTNSTWGYATRGIIIKPNSFFEKDNIGHFGVSYDKGGGNLEYGIYSFGNGVANMPVIVSNPYMLSDATMTQPVITACAYCQSTNTMLVAWYNAQTSDINIDRLAAGGYRQQDWKIQTGWITNFSEQGKEIKLTIPYRKCASVFVSTGTLTAKNGSSYSFDLVKDTDRNCFFTTVRPDSIDSFYITFEWSTTGLNTDGLEIEKLIIDIL